MFFICDSISAFSASVLPFMVALSFSSASFAFVKSPVLIASPSSFASPSPGSRFESFI
jgi:hypothetical protein